MVAILHVLLDRGQWYHVIARRYSGSLLYIHVITPAARGCGGSSSIRCRIHISSATIVTIPIQWHNNEWQYRRLNKVILFEDVVNKIVVD